MKKFIVVLFLIIVMLLCTACKGKEAVHTPALSNTIEETILEETILWENVLTESWP